jgi:hypothetical protein
MTCATLESPFPKTTSAVPCGVSMFRKQKRVSTDPLEDSAENREDESRGGAVSKWARYLRISRDSDASADSVFTERLRASADVEDDGAETQLIEDERRRDET